MLLGMDELSAPPEMVLIEELRKQLPKDQSAVNRVAKASGISEGRWRQLAKGFQQATPTVRVQAIAPPGTLARMAIAVGATAQQIADAGRSDAADEMAAISKQQGQLPPTPTERHRPLEESQEVERRRQELTNLRVKVNGTWNATKATVNSAVRDLPELSQRGRECVLTLSWTIAELLTEHILENRYADGARELLDMLYEDKIEFRRLLRPGRTSEDQSPLPITSAKEQEDVVEATPESDASGEAQQVQEVLAPTEGNDAAAAVKRDFPDRVKDLSGLGGVPGVDGGGGQGDVEGGHDAVC